MANTRHASLLAILFLLALPAHAASLEGVTLPDTQSDNGRELSLNGIGLRTASVFHVKVYVAGLYLEHRQHDGEAIIRSPAKKVLVIHFLRDISAEDARTAWQEGFDGNCHAPCRLAPQNVARFLASVHGVRAGDVARLVFAADGLRVFLNGVQAGVVHDRDFARVILATFIGRSPPTPELKHALLGQGR